MHYLLSIQIGDERGDGLDLLFLTSGCCCIVVDARSGSIDGIFYALDAACLVDRYSSTDELRGNPASERDSCKD